MIAFTEKQYGEMIIHPCPINYLCIIMVPVSLLGEKIRLFFAKVFGLAIFWGENVIFMLFFLSFELILLPILYV